MATRVQDAPSSACPVEIGSARCHTERLGSLKVRSAETGLANLLVHLKTQGYDFVTVTPSTHARVLERPFRARASLRDIFGWNRAFANLDVAPDLLSLLEMAGKLERRPEGVRSKVRVAALDGLLFLHSAYPTDSPDAVFFGPDTYRFVRFLKRHLSALGRPTWIVEMGAGSGAAGIIASRQCPSARTTLVDVNPSALELARCNARAAGVAVETTQSNQIPIGADLIIANPPYLIDGEARTYRHGGGLLGSEVALDWVRQALAALSPGGAMLLYTGAAFVNGKAPLLDTLERICAAALASVELEELDPDVFGEELVAPAYANVERIAAIGALIRRPK